jgi:gamma-butyrobetaine dioxygenase
VPGFQLLHALVNRTGGGLSTLVDGFAAAEALRLEDPDGFAILCNTRLKFRFVDADAEIEDWSPMIVRDADGAYRQVRFSHRLDFVPPLPRAELDAFYRARARLAALLRDPARELRFRLADGDLMIMDNQRTLHGRTSFDPQEGNRHLQGCYIDRDGVLSRLAVLQRDYRPAPKR